MRKIEVLMIHCSATPYGADFSAADICRWHKERGFQTTGYHYVIRLDGMIEAGRPVDQEGAHCKGWNARSIGICYIGGLDAQGNPADTRTDAQKQAMRELICQLQARYPIKRIMGHRDASPDCNGNGVVEPWEYVKACPCFDVATWVRGGMKLLLLLVLFSSCGSHRTFTEKQEGQQVQVDHRLIDDSYTRKGQEQVSNETVEECVEQTTWQFVIDTVRQRPGKLVQVSCARTERISRREQSAHEQREGLRRQMQTDTVQMEYKSEVLRTKDTDVGTVVGWWWLFPTAVTVLWLSFLYFRKKS